MDLAFGYDAAGDILSMTDAVHPDRSQSFIYDAVSRLTSADGGYGEIDYAYNLGGDRTQRVWSRDGNAETEDYTYDQETARLSTVSLTDAANATSIKRQFDYAPTGQVVRDTRGASVGAPVFDYGLNARGRMVSVTDAGGTALASYTYDADEQRIIKTANGRTIHYHYDLEGRLISETDGASGEVIRDYIWLGLTPLAVIATETGGEPCDSDAIAALQAQITDLQNRISTKQSQLAPLQRREARFTRINDRNEARKARIEQARARVEDRITRTEQAIAATNNVWRRWRLRQRLRSYQRQRNRYLRQERNLDRTITRLEARRAPVSAQIATLTGEITSLTAQITALEEQIAALEAACEGGGNGSGSSSTDTDPVLTFLHADHLGRPVIGTDTSGAVVWDGGITTPFGEAVSTAGAFSQSLMFPGQYQDAETEGAGVTLSHNWHRTYDPTLGRYLQADPIGLAGGLNRYAYVAGQPTKMIDPDGLNFVQGELNGYMPRSVDMAANLAEAASMRNKGCVEKLIWFYNNVNYDAPWDYKTTNQVNRRFDQDFGYSPDFENFGNWHYGVVGAAAGIPSALLTNAAGAVQIKNGTSSPQYPSSNALQKDSCTMDCRYAPLIPSYWDDPKDQYWIQKGIDDFNNGNYQVLRGMNFLQNSNGR